MGKSQVESVREKEFLMEQLRKFKHCKLIGRKELVEAFPPILCYRGSELFDSFWESVHFSDKFRNHTVNHPECLRGFKNFLAGLPF